MKQGDSIVFLGGRFKSSFGYRQRRHRSFLFSCLPIRRISKSLVTTSRPRRPEGGC
ncbi:hypothetical protein HAX54_046814, partial [Datura stramonium]|nr:hypothetical protein [Datura stramonium]